MLRILSLFVLIAFLASCGVKQPPIAPERPKNPPPPPKLDCSSTDPDCDKKDPGYKPTH